MTGRPVVLKFGGELLEDPARVKAIAKVVRQAAARVPLVVVHGGGREIDRALFSAGIGKQQVDGLRITDEATLNVVVAVLAGTINTKLVALLNASGVAAVGLTGADAGVAPVRKAAAHITAAGARVSLGLVGEPLPTGKAPLLTRLVSAGFVPVIASVSAAKTGRLFNVNADTLAANIAVRIGARRLIITGATAGVLDGDGATLPLVDAAAASRMVKSGAASAGMVAKLTACRTAAKGGVGDVRIADGRVPANLLAALMGQATGAWTRVK
ncbi:MAG TPA: acetylglutamate kinase [Vicinamibacterales bacterium]|nr:acetylglutamate kinase [Vicinamibacterales bacterium]